MERVFGLDVSKHQGEIDWVKVKASGVEFVMIRVGYRGYGNSGKINLDPYFVKNIQGALAVGLKVGIYFYSQALNEEEAREEAYFVIENIEPYKDKITLPVVCDGEGYNVSTQRVYGLQKEQITKNCIAFQEVIKANGYACMLYGSQAYLLKKFDLNKLTEPLWVARYPSRTKPNSDEKYFPKVNGYQDRIAMWQYASCGFVDGIKPRVDMNYMYIDVTTDKAFSQEEEVKEPMIRMYAKGKKVQLAPNFKSTEFDCNGKGCCAETPIHDNLILVCQAVRDKFKKSVKINSGYRCEVYNKKVSGASANSKHKLGLAADIVVKGKHPMQVARFVEKFFNENGIKGRIGVYTWNDKGDGFVHVDVRGTNSRAVYTENNTQYDNVIKFNVPIKRETKGKIVTVVERFLASRKYKDEKGKWRKYYEGEIDEKCGPKLEKGITLWNEHHGRPNDAIWGPKCWQEAFPI